jgi:hypothetical protein
MDKCLVQVKLANISYIGTLLNVLLLSILVKHNLSENFPHAKFSPKQYVKLYWEWTLAIDLKASYSDTDIDHM